MNGDQKVCGLLNVMLHGRVLEDTCNRHETRIMGRVLQTTNVGSILNFFPNIFSDVL